MKMQRFNGYPLTLRTKLSPQECHLRLVGEFYGAGGRWRHAASDKRLLGWQEGSGFIIYLRAYHEAKLHRHSASTRSIDTSRSMRLRIQPNADGTLISGRYAHTNAEGLLLLLVIGLTFGIILGVLAVVGGGILAFRVPQALWLVALGASLLGVCCWLLLDTGDGGFARERDAIARYLARVLEAEPIAAPTPHRSGTRIQRQRKGADW